MEVTWRFWNSDDGSHYATRLGFLTDAQIDGGLAMTLAADSREELDAAITEQMLLQQRLGGTL
ncbi:hypothetical protein [Actinomadura hibisca]|uniref:hypothetical protein n=1 Tax=Actinomadura hibisca TaxID=68565 RepID=UPI000832CC8F|nr:hypothetical protein [Actinomadura hibisca]